MERGQGRGQSCDLVGMIAESDGGYDWRDPHPEGVSGLLAEPGGALPAGYLEEVELGAEVEHGPVLFPPGLRVGGKLVDCGGLMPVEDGRIDGALSEEEKGGGDLHRGEVAKVANVRVERGIGLGEVDHATTSFHLPRDGPRSSGQASSRCTYAYRRRRLGGQGQKLLHSRRCG